MKGWSYRNERIHVPMQRTQSKRYTLLAAISCNGVVKQELFDGNINTDRFIDFLNLIKSSPQQLVLLDNASFHKSSRVLETFKSIGKTPVYVSPYSPEWNPIEHYFSLLKNRFRKEYRMETTNDMKTRLQLHSDSIDKTTFSNIFRKVFGDISKRVHK